MTDLRRRVGAFAQGHQGALTVAGSIAAIAALAVVLGGRWNDFAVALAGAPLGILALAAGLQVASLELVQPTLDDVFVEKTGRHLEGAAEPRETAEVPPAAVT